MEHQMSYLQKHPDVTKSRLNTFMSNGQFKKANIHASLYESRVNGSPHVQMEVWAADGQERPTFEHAVKQEFQPIEVGHSFGLSWSTHWVRATLQIPSDFAGKEVRLIFDPSCEAMVWSAEGQALQGITGGNGQDRRVNFVVTKKAKASETKRVLYLEVACNGMFGLGDYLIGPPDENRSFTLNTADLVVKQVDAWALYHDLDILKQMIEGLPKDSPRWWQALSTANAIINAYDAKDSTTLTTGLEISRKFFGAKSGDATHQVFAIGNCHIDTA
ncbi:Glycoside hydrolase, 38 vacuolar alpha mannosidase, partial [Kickxella alabastrina]